MATLPPAPRPAARSSPSGAPRAYRVIEDSLLGGVAAGLAVHLGVPVLRVRLGFVALAALGGFGVATYAGLWLVLPAPRHFEAGAPGLEAATRQGRRRGTRSRRLVDTGGTVALLAIGVGLMALIAGVGGLGPVVVPLTLALAGVALVWRQADQAQRARWRDVGGRLGPVRAVVGDGGAAGWLRLVAGLAAVVVAVGLLGLRTGSIALAVQVGLLVLVGVVVLAVVLGPWVVRLAADLSEERAERVRTQERADVAAHLHDSVLQTLALIQNAATDPTRVAALARAQERDLRSWLFEASDTDPTTLSAELRTVADRAEAAHGVPVEVVCVGDRPLPRSSGPLVLATAEAVANAARHSGSAVVDVYAEVGDVATEIFVRDRGRGFDPDAVAGDRHGLRHSVHDRLRRHGGESSVRSAPGRGTEVRLRLPHTEQEEGP